MNRSFDITVVVCTFNRAAWLPDVIGALADQATAGDFNYDLLIVDNASTDETPRVVQEQMAREDVTIRYVREETPGVSAARNRGIKDARGDWIAFCDDDQLADPQWLAELVKLANDKDCRIVGGAIHLVRANESSTQGSDSQVSGQRLSSALERLLAPGGRSRAVKQFDRRDALNSGNQMVHRDVFEQVGGYNEGCREGGEDTDWFHRVESAGLEAWFTPAASVRHLVPDYRLSLPYLRWVSLRQGWGLGRHQVEHDGLLAACLGGLARLAQAGLQHFPLQLIARIRGQRDQVTYRRCRQWRAAGLNRYLLRRILPTIFPQQDFRSWIEFRAEREQFATDSIPHALSR